MSVRIFYYLLRISLFFAAYASMQVHAQEAENKKKWELGGYLKNMQTAHFTDVNTDWQFINLIHNREDFRYYPGKAWQVHVGMRNRIYYGPSVGLLAQNSALFKSVNSYFDLQKTIAKGPSYIVHSTLDRFSLKYTHKRWEVTTGRQRINWGQNLVWNPNDIFNAYSYFNFDYEERPGADGIRIQYYPSGVSDVEVAYKPGKTLDSTIAAGLYRFSWRSYDIQVLGGWMNKDYVLGGGWSGVMKGAGFNGEITAFVPDGGNAAGDVSVSASAGANYTFQNSMYLHISYLYCGTGMLKADSARQDILFSQVVSAKTLSPARHSIFAEAAYQFTPLIRGNISGIVAPADGSFFLGPFLNFSISNNVEFLAGGQLFFGASRSIYGGYGQFVFARLKWSF